MSAADDRYSRQDIVPGWSQQSLQDARVLVIGAGALGNEVLKNLALLGVGRIDVADFDFVERSNLSRCVLLREGDVGQSKAAAACSRMREAQPGLNARALDVNVLYQLGAGTLRDYDLVLGCVDNIEARLRINGLCRTAGRVWLDGGMDAFGGQVALFDPSQGACFECGMTERMWARMAERHSCLRLGSGSAMDDTPRPALVTLASAIGALQAQEAVRWLQREARGGCPPLRPGQRLCLQSRPYALTVLHGKENPDCAVHGQTSVPQASGFQGATSYEQTRVIDLLRRFEAEVLQLEGDLVIALSCRACGNDEASVLPLYALTPERVRCPACREIRLPELLSTIGCNDEMASLSLAACGIPRRAVVRMQQGRRWIAVELPEPAEDNERSNGLGEGHSA